MNPVNVNFYDSDEEELNNKAHVSYNWDDDSFMDEAILLELANRIPPLKRNILLINL